VRDLDEDYSTRTKINCGTSSLSLSYVPHYSFHALNCLVLMQLNKRYTIICFSEINWLNFCYLLPDFQTLLCPYPVHERSFTLS